MLHPEQFNEEVADNENEEVADNEVDSNMSGMAAEN